MIFIAEIVLRLFFRFRNGIHTTNPNGVERLIAPGETRGKQSPHDPRNPEGVKLFYKIENHLDPNHV